MANTKKGKEPIIKEYVNPQKAEEYKKLFREKVFSLKDIGVTSRVFHEWKKLGLIDIPLNKENQGWTNLSFGEYVWLKIIQDLRKFGCSLADIMSAKRAFMGNQYWEHEDLVRIGADTLAKDFLELIAKQFNPKFFPGMVERVAKGISEKRVYELLLDSMGKPLNNLELMIINMLATKNDAYLLFTLKNSVSPQAVEESEDKKQLTEKRTGRKKASAMLNLLFTMDKFPRVSPETPHLKISLRHYIKEFIGDETKQMQLVKIQLLSKDELELLKQIRNGNATEITVKLIDNKIDRIEVTKNLKKDAETRIIETFTSSEYSDITYTVANGKIVKFKKTTKIKSE